MATLAARLSAAAAVTLFLLGARSLHAQDVSFGQRLYQEKADCQFCHGINGDGRGDPRSAGRAANLHETRLKREQPGQSPSILSRRTELPAGPAVRNSTCIWYGARQDGTSPMRGLTTTARN